MSIMETTSVSFWLNPAASSRNCDVAMLPVASMIFKAIHAQRDLTTAWLQQLPCPPATHCTFLAVAG
eukprot:1002702-Amphidinium_carterae.1